MYSVCHWVFSTPVQVRDDVVEGTGHAAARVIDARGARPRGEDRAVHDVLHIDEVADLLAVLEDARRLVAADLLCELEDLLEAAPLCASRGP